MVRRWVEPRKTIIQCERPHRERMPIANRRLCQDGPKIRVREEWVFRDVEVVVPVGEAVVEAGQVDDERNGEDRRQTRKERSRADRRGGPGTSFPARAPSSARIGTMIATARAQDGDITPAVETRPERSSTFPNDGLGTVQSHYSQLLPPHTRHGVRPLEIASDRDMDLWP